MDKIQFGQELWSDKIRTHAEKIELIQFFFDNYPVQISTLNGPIITSLQIEVKPGGSEAHINKALEILKFNADVHTGHDS